VFNAGIVMYSFG